MGTRFPSPKGAHPQFSANVRCGQTAGWTKMPLGTEVGLVPGDFVFDGDPASPRKKARPHPIFGPCLLWSNGWMVQDATWYGGKPRPRGLCVRYGHKYSPQFSVHVYCGQTTGWMKTPLGTEVDLGQGHLFVRRGPSCRENLAQQPPPSFRPVSIVATVAHLSYY